MASIFIGEFFSQVPIWVWPLFFLLFWIGWRSSKPREVPLVVYYFTPALVLMSLNEVRFASPPEVAWIVFCVGYFAGIITGYQLQKRWLIEKRGWKAIVDGEWFTMTTIMIIFWTSFAKGTTLAIAPAVASSLLFLAITLAVTSWASGSFLGRMLWIIRSR